MPFIMDVSCILTFNISYFNGREVGRGHIKTFFEMLGRILFFRLVLRK